MSDKDKRKRHYCFTINNYSDSELERFKQVAESLEKHRYICFGLERGEKNDTPHIQGYIQLNQSQRLLFLHKYFNLKRENEKLHKFHIEVTNGSAEQNRTYCSKEGQFFEFGEMVEKKGQRTDMEILRELVVENPQNADEIVREHCTSLQQIKFVETWSRYQFKHRDKNKPPVVIWIFGSTGVGKTRIVCDTFEDVCIVSDCKWPGTGYFQNECLLFDDFRPGDMDFNTLLRITDRFKANLAVKGGSIALNSPYILFTAPMSIKHMYKGEQREDIAQLLRRVVQIDLDIWKDEIKYIDLRNPSERYLYEGVSQDMDRSRIPPEDFDFDD